MYNFVGAKVLLNLIWVYERHDDKATLYQKLVLVT